MSVSNKSESTLEKGMTRRGKIDFGDDVHLANQATRRSIRNSRKVAPGNQGRVGEDGIRHALGWQLGESTEEVLKMIMSISGLRMLQSGPSAICR